MFYISDTEHLLEHKSECHLSWDEPRPAMHGGFCNPTNYVPVTITASVRDCISMQRRNDATRSLNEDRLLEDFICVHHAYISTAS
jgi:hypothetical protein